MSHSEYEWEEDYEYEGSEVEWEDDYPLVRPLFAGEEVRRLSPRTMMRQNLMITYAYKVYVMMVLARLMKSEAGVTRAVLMFLGIASVKSDEGGASSDPAIELDYSSSSSGSLVPHFSSSSSSSSGWL